MLLASLFCGPFWGLTWFNRKVQFSLFIAQLVTTSFAVVTWRVQILLPVWQGEPRPENSLVSVRQTACLPERLVTHTVDRTNINLWPRGAGMSLGLLLCRRFQ